MSVSTIFGELFKPKLPPVWIEPVDLPPARRANTKITGVAALLAQCTPDPTFVPTKTAAQVAESKKNQKKEENASKLQKEKLLYSPATDKNLLGPIPNTLFVARLRYNTTEQDLRECFEEYGTVEKISITLDPATKKPRGYAFILFDSPKAVARAILGANNLLFHGSRIVADSCKALERNWYPMRLGGGIAGRKIKHPEPEQSYRPPVRIIPRRGGFNQSSRSHTPYDRSRGRGRGRGGAQGSRGAPPRRQDRQDHSRPRDPRDSRDSRPRDSRDSRPRDSRPRDPHRDPRDSRPRDPHTRDSRYVQDFDGPKQNWSRGAPRGQNNPPPQERPGRTLRKY